VKNQISFLGRLLNQTEKNSNQVINHENPQTKGKKKVLHKKYENQQNLIHCPGDKPINLV